jgi:ABC-type transporter Mla MlaB component
MERIDSAGIALLLEWQRLSTNDNLNCRYEGLPKQAKKLIEAYRLQSLIGS